MEIIFDSFFNILTFKLKGIDLTYGISERIKTISLSKFIPEEAYLEFETNIGTEGADIINKSVLGEALYTKNKDYIRGLSLSDIKVRYV